jgi:hypothetical protein
MTETTSSKTASSQNWPSLRVDEWTASCYTLHMWAQIVGKIRLAQAPMVNHWSGNPLRQSSGFDHVRDSTRSGRL